MNVCLTIKVETAGYSSEQYCIDMMLTKAVSLLGSEARREARREMELVVID